MTVPAPQTRGGVSQVCGSWGFEGRHWLGVFAPTPGAMGLHSTQYSGTVRGLLFACLLGLGFAVIIHLLGGFLFFGFFKSGDGLR